MARNKTAETPSNEVAENVTENTEVEATEPEIDLAAFNFAVSEALEGADSDTGDLGTQFFEGVNKAYQALDGIKAKNAAKRLLEDGMSEALDNNDLSAAKVFMRLKDKATVTTRTPVEKKAATPADIAQAFADRVTVLRVADAFLRTQAPEGADGWAEKVGDTDTLAGQADTLAAWLDTDSDERGDEPEVSAIVRSAIKVARGKVTRSAGAPRVSNGLRRNVAAHILNAFEGVESGTFLTVSEIVNTPSAEYDGDKPSAGAVSVRLFPASGKGCSVTGVNPGANDKGTRGATKA